MVILRNKKVLFFVLLMSALLIFSAMPAYSIEDDISVSVDDDDNSSTEVEVIETTGEISSAADFIESLSNFSSLTTLNLSQAEFLESSVELDLSKLTSLKSFSALGQSKITSVILPDGISLVYLTRTSIKTISIPASVKLLFLNDIPTLTSLDLSAATNLSVLSVRNLTGAGENIILPADNANLRSLEISGDQFLFLNAKEKYSSLTSFNGGSQNPKRTDIKASGAEFDLSRIFEAAATAADSDVVNFSAISNVTAVDSEGSTLTGTLDNGGTVTWNKTAAALKSISYEYDSGVDEADNINVTVTLSGQAETDDEESNGSSGVEEVAITTEISSAADFINSLAQIPGLTALSLSNATFKESSVNLDFSSFTSLKSLNVSGQSAVTSITLPSSIEEFNGGGTNITSFIAPASLKVLFLNNAAELKTLDLSAATDLMHLVLDGATGLTTLDLTKNTALKNLTINDAVGLTRLDLSTNTSLVNLSISGLTGAGENIILPADNANLKTLDISENQFLFLNAKKKYSSLTSFSGGGQSPSRTGIKASGAAFNLSRIFEAVMTAADSDSVDFSAITKVTAVDSDGTTLTGTLGSDGTVTWDKSAAALKSISYEYDSGVSDADKMDITVALSGQAESEADSNGNATVDPVTTETKADDDSNFQEVTVENIGAMDNTEKQAVEEAKVTTTVTRAAALVESLKELPNLTTLSLKETTFEETSVTLDLSGMTNLKNLSVAGQSAVTSVTLPTGIEEVNLSGTKITKIEIPVSVTVLNLGSVDTLTELNLANNTSIKILSIPSLTGAGENITLPETSDALQELDISGNQFMFLNALARFKNMNKFSGSGQKPKRQSFRSSGATLNLARLFNDSSVNYSAISSVKGVDSDGSTLTGKMDEDGTVAWEDSSGNAATATALQSISYEYDASVTTASVTGASDMNMDVSVELSGQPDTATGGSGGGCSTGLGTLGLAAIAAFLFKRKR